MSVVKAAISMRPFPKLRTGSGGESFMNWRFRTEVQVMGTEE